MHLLSKLFKCGSLRKTFHLILMLSPEVSEKEKLKKIHAIAHKFQLSQGRRGTSR